MNKRVLEIANVSVRYGGVVAVREVNVDVDAGALVGIIGPNGAGKTTLIDAVSGFVPYQGNIKFTGASIDAMSPSKRSRAGLARTFQAGELFDDLSVLDNILVGSFHGRLRGALGEILRCREAAPSETVSEVIEMFDLDANLHRKVQDLPVGSRKLVAVARALASSPKLVLLDEPAAGLDTVESRALGEKLRLLSGIGVSVVLVDHDMDLVLGVCDSVYVMDTGQVIASGSGSSIRSNPTVIEAYLGTPATEHAI